MNSILLTFFLWEISMKLFAYGFNYLSEVILAFDAIIVIVSFVFHVSDFQLQGLGLLRILRLIKVISGMKKVVDEKRER